MRRCQVFIRYGDEQRQGFIARAIKIVHPPMFPACEVVAVIPTATEHDLTHGGAV